LRDGMQRQKKAYLYGIAAVIFWSTSASAFKICLSPERLNTGPTSLLLCASVTGTLALLIYLLLSGKIKLLWGVSRAEVLRSAFLGLLSPFLYYTILFRAYSILRAQEAQPLNFVWPLVLVLLSGLLLKQKVRCLDIIGIVISFLGVLVISTEGHILSLKLSEPMGVALALSSSIPWALYWIYNVKDRRDDAVKLFVNFVFASAYVFLMLLVGGGFEELSLPQIMGATYVGLFEMGITFLLWLKALKLSERTAGVAGLVYLVPFLSLVVISQVVGEKILASTIAGALLIVGGILVQKVGLPAWGTEGTQERAKGRGGS